MLQGKQRGTYLADQSLRSLIITRAIEVVIWIGKVKLDDMAGLVAASDASPPAAVLATPRGEEVGAVICDALLEGEQGGPLGRDAAAAAAAVVVLG